jgi:SAM-dependent methyltransferase/protein-tyrosine-phosphatase/mannose-6-phosphate isomerase-like protein (cupin superfamily)
MAEGWARVLAPEIEAHSAGTEPSRLNPLAVRAMAEAGVDISRHASKRPEAIGGTFDAIVTVCDSAHEHCPIVPGARIIHAPFDDPPRLAQGDREGAASDDEAMPHYRRVRDEIRRFVQALPRTLGIAEAAHYTAAALAMRPNVDGAACWAVALGKAMLTRFEVKPGARFERHAHEAEQITLVLVGSLTFEFDGRPPITAHAGEVVAIPSNLPHAAIAGPHGADAVDAWSPPRAEFALAIPTPAHQEKRTMSTQDKTSSACCGPDCCTPQPAASRASTPTGRTPDDVRDTVRAGYAKIAEAGSWSAAQAAPAATSSCCSPKSGGGCCGPSTFTPEDLAAAVGYAQSDLSALPEGANMGLSCGNPTALASLRPGEVVLDLGSGGGFDCFIAGPKVGRDGRVIGVDMTPAMVTKARGNVAAYTAQTGLENVEFRLGEIENIPARDNSVDVVISNCVLNLSPDQPRVWREIARILKPGGRVAVSDLVLLKPLPPNVRADVEALVGCVAGATPVGLIENMARKAGLTDVRVERKPGYVENMLDWQDPLYRRIIESLGAREKLADFVTSANITAMKA